MDGPPEVERLGRAELGDGCGVHSPVMFDLNEFLDYFDRVRGRTRRVAACIPEDQLEWRPKTGAFSLGDLVRHIAVTERYMWAETVFNRPSRYLSHGPELAAGRTGVLDFLDALHQESMAMFRTLTPRALAGKCTTPEGSPITTWKWLRAMAEHEIHHRGQIYLLLNLLSVPTPPLYGLTSEQVREKSQKVDSR
jgi:uncharacterized damage-inducible protein DinB